MYERECLFISVPLEATCYPMLIDEMGFLSYFSFLDGGVHVNLHYGQFE